MEHRKGECYHFQPILKYPLTKKIKIIIKITDDKHVQLFNNIWSLNLQQFFQLTPYWLFYREVSPFQIVNYIEYWCIYFPSRLV